jgi:hypothetical protein
VRRGEVQRCFEPQAERVEDPEIGGIGPAEAVLCGPTHPPLSGLVEPRELVQQLESLGGAGPVPFDRLPTGVARD